MRTSFATRSGPVPTDRYAPDFRVEVEGRELDPATKGDVLDLKVTMDMDEMTSVDMTFNNWDDRALFFKYSDTTALNVGSRIHVLMGYSDRLLSIMRGQINSLTPRFPQSGSPTITVNVLDGMQLLKERQPAEGEEIKYTQKADWQIAEAVATRNGLTAEVTREGPVLDEVVQKNQNDAQFLMERAKRIDFDCYVYTDPETAQTALRFMRPSDERAGGSRAHELVWSPIRQSFEGLEPNQPFHPLLSFEPTLTLSNQVSSVTVRAWDAAAKQAIVATATADDLPGSAEGRSGPHEAQRALGNAQSVVVDAVVTSEEEARELAISLLRERAYEFITGAGELMGMPELRPGHNVNLRGLGRRFSGLYYVKKVEHSLGSSGFTTRFEARRVFDGGTEGAGET
jgi:phage protein D